MSIRSSEREQEAKMSDIGDVELEGDLRMSPEAADLRVHGRPRSTTPKQGQVTMRHRESTSICKQDIRMPKQINKPKLDLKQASPNTYSIY